LAGFDIRRGDRVGRDADEGDGSARVCEVRPGVAGGPGGDVDVGGRGSAAEFKAVRVGLEIGDAVVPGAIEDEGIRGENRGKSGSE